MSDTLTAVRIEIGTVCRHTATKVRYTVTDVYEKAGVPMVGLLSWGGSRRTIRREEFERDYVGRSVPPQEPSPAGPPEDW